MKIKTADLIDAPLDWVVATIEGYGELRRNPHAFDQSLIMNRRDGQCVLFFSLKYSTDWAQGGPIIEREGISLNLWAEFGWRAGARTGKSPASFYSGPTPLVAAMRCFVAAHLGDEVEIPDELMKQP